MIREKECYNMKCPKCGKEMEAGFLQCNMDSSISWVSKLLPLGLGYWKKDAIVVSDILGSGVNATPAHICKQCKLFLADYSQKA